MALILDTSVLFAALDRSDRRHPSCRDLLQDAEEMLIVPSVVVPELDYLVARSLGPGAMVAFLRDVEDGAFLLEDLVFDDVPRVRDLVDRYSDADVGFVDAAVLTIVERLGESKLATLDRRHFSLMRPRHVDALELVPA